MAETERWEPFLRMPENSRLKNNRCRAVCPVVWFSQRFWADLGYVLDDTEFLGRSVSFQLMQTRSGNSLRSSVPSSKRTNFIWLPSNDYLIPLWFSVLFTLSLLYAPVPVPTKVIGIQMSTRLEWRVGMSTINDARNKNLSDQLFW
jgi:hypothetical protein